jgi:hypothetical protein
MSGQKRLEVTFVYNRENHFGIAKDAEILEEGIRTWAKVKNVGVNKIRHVDPKEPPVPCDICIHLEIPYAVWFPWARFHAVLVNPEWWMDKAWDGYSSQIDSWLFRTDGARNRFVESGLCRVENSSVLRWKTKGDLTALLKNPMSTDKNDGWVWFLAGSTNKREAAKAVLPLWNSSWPKVNVYTIEPLELGDSIAPNVHIHVQDLSSEEHTRLAAFYPGHICLSKSEGFGYTAAEAEFVGAFTMLNTIEAYTENYGYCNPNCVAWVKTPEVSSGKALLADFENKEELYLELEKANNAFMTVRLEDARECRILRRTDSVKRASQFDATVGDWFGGVVNNVREKPSLPKHMPPILHSSDCPSISIITLVYGRPQFLDLAFHNLMLSDYPRAKIEWVVVDDSPAEESGSDKIAKFEEMFYPGKLTYVPLTKKVSIGKKRNIGVKKAKHDILLMMDDDDHYPQTSFRRRVAWLVGGKGLAGKGCAVCTSIAMYDLQKGISAVNVPPYGLSLSQRCSEATLTFTRDFWLAREFPDTSTSEGEGFLDGREADIVEIPPQQILVAFTHGLNTTSRGVPDAGKQGVGCFWGFPRPYLEFIHGLAGVKVEEA